ncbi:MAG TPA: universal stress protein [Vicinamibacterales bacterium]|jgi:nucleotide-binding universal stress UspA family protein|nr:universal stress protein [Vicinamibacterales bacterium]
MYRNILVAIEHSDADKAVLSHIEQLARLTGARLLLVHVADGFAARHFEDLKLRESEEIKDDRAYLERLCAELVSRGFDTRARLALGDPASELVKVAAQEDVDLIAMSTHGHRFLNDLIRGSTADRLRHRVTVPVLMVRAMKT